MLEVGEMTTVKKQNNSKVTFSYRNIEKGTVASLVGGRYPFLRPKREILNIISNRNMFQASSL